MNGLAALALVLAVLAAVGMVRLERGPTAVDRMMAAQLVGTLGVALVLVLGAMGGEGVQMVALVVALLAAVSGVAFVRRYLPAGRADDD